MCAALHNQVNTIVQSRKWCRHSLHRTSLLGKSNLDLNTHLELDRGDVLDNVSGSVEVDETLVDPHLESVPGLGTLTTGTECRKHQH